MLVVGAILENLIYYVLHMDAREHVPLIIGKLLCFQLNSFEEVIYWLKCFC